MWFDVSRWTRVGRVALSVLILTACGGGAEDGNDSDSIADITVSPASSQTAVGNELLFSAQARNASGDVLTGKTFTFTVDNPAIAQVTRTIGDTASIKALSVGTATVTAQSGGRSGTGTIVVAEELTVTVAGRVIDGLTGNPLVGALVGVGVNPPSRAVTNSDGAYQRLLTFSAAENFRSLVVSQPGYETATFNLSRASLRPSGTPPLASLPPILMAPTTTERGSISGVVRNARDNAPIGGAGIYLFSGQSDGTDFENRAHIKETRSDLQGGYTFTDLPAGAYGVQVAASGFSACSRNAIAVPQSTPVFNQDVVCSPTGTSQVRVVLTWGANPSDLDAHLVGPNPTDAGRFHTYFASRGNAGAAPFAVLDVDDTSSNGPETITITQLSSGVYRYAVHDFTNRNSATSTALGGSGAKVELYLPGSGNVQQFFVPNQRGTLWTVFELVGPIDNPTVTVRNEMGLATDPGAIQVADPGGVR